MIRYQSRNFKPEQIVKRFAGLGADGFVIYDVNAKGYTIRETIVERSALPEALALQCEERKGQAFNQVEISE